MSYPIAPKSLTIAFGNKRSYEAQLLKQRLKGGVDERSTGLSIHPITDSWSLSLEIHGLPRYKQIENFIKEREGDPFRFDWDGDGVEDGSLYRIESHQWNWSEYHHWQLSMELKGVHRP